MSLILPSETIFHAIESTIKSYRKFAQQSITEHIDGITIDQSLALIYLDKFPELNQIALAELLFKDTASLTRMIKAMVSKGFLEREINQQDLRRNKFRLTSKGKEVIAALPKVITNNREIALDGLSQQEQQMLKGLLHKIRQNCNNQIK